VGIFDSVCTTEDLTTGMVVYCKALAENKGLSARYPASGGVTVPAINPVSSITPATLQVTDDRDGENATATLTDSASAMAINEVYLARYSANGPLVFTLAGSRTGDGDITLSPGPGNWVAQVRSTIGAATGIGLGSTFWVTAADDRRRMRMRDRTAGGALRVARRMGFQIAYQSPGLQQINLWAIPETFSRSTSMLGGEVGTTVGKITVPRQADFPPYDGIEPGAKVWIDGVPYGADISWNAESEDMSAAFVMDLRRLDVSVELDDEDNIE
jgi:hypothetical protein